MWITEDTVVTDHGVTVNFGIVHKEPFTIIIPLEGNSTTIVGQYRYAVDYFSWEFPMGHYESKHGSIEDSAKTELREETGLIAGNVKLIGDFYLGSGHHTQKGYVYIATDLTKGSSDLEPSERGMESRKIELSEVENLVEKGIIKDGPTITALKLLQLYLKGDR